MSPPLSLTVDELRALNDQLRALAVAEIGLEPGLRHLGDGLPGRAAAAAEQLATRLERGEALPTALEATCELAPMYVAVVEAGVRSGRLAVALEGLASTLRRVHDLQRLISFSLIYPCVIAALAYALFVGGLAFAPIVTVTDFTQLELDPTPLARVVSALRDTVWWWAPWPPLLMIGLVWWIRRRLQQTDTSDHQRSLLNMTRLVRLGRLATFVEVLQLLLANDLPATEAIELAANASGDAGLRNAADEFQRRTQAGESLNDPPEGMPPLLGWMLGSPWDKGTVGCLQRLSESYREQAYRSAAWLRLYLPLALTVVLGGATTLAYGLATLGPWYSLLLRMANVFY